MTYLASFSGTYRSRFRVWIGFMWITGPWKTQTFSFQRSVSVPELHFEFDPVKNLPLGVTVDVDADSVTFGLDLVGQNIPIENYALPKGGVRTINWSPLKGVEIDAVAMFKAMPPVPGAGS